MQVILKLFSWGVKCSVYGDSNAIFAKRKDCGGLPLQPFLLVTMEWKRNQKLLLPAHNVPQPNKAILNEPAQFFGLSLSWDRHHVLIHVTSTA